MEQEDSSDNPDDNPLAFLGLQRVGKDYSESPSKSDLNSIELNRRGIPARKRKKNSLIYGSDDLVSIPVKSPKKKVISTPTKSIKESPNKKVKVTPKAAPDSFDEESDDYGREPELSDIEDDFEEEEEPRTPPPLPVTPKKAIERTKSRLELEEELESMNRACAQRLGYALRNLLKLPKAHKWVCFEFFYSNIDRVLFCGENDFMVCLKESFPQLKTRRLSRVEWCKIRRMMGKPRRCSEAFFTEERAELARKRKKIRFLQQRKIGDASSYKDLPENIPMQLTIGCRVTARLRVPQDGLFTGVVAAVDTSNSTYRITFDREGLGTHSIPDYELLSTDPPDVIPLSSFLAKSRHRPPAPSSYLSPPYPTTASFSPQLTGDPLMSGSTPRGKSLRLDGVLGGYPVKFLYHIVKLNKSLLAKKEKVKNLRELNSEAEKLKSFGEFMTEDFQRKYAGSVMEVYKVNEELNKQLKEVSSFTAQFSADAGPTLSMPEQIRENCKEESYEMVTKLNCKEELFGAPKEEPVVCKESEQVQVVQSPKLLGLISSLSALMLQIKRVADGERNAAELQAIKESLSEIEKSLSGENSKVFQDSVMVHMQHILQGLSQMGNLTAFMSPAETNNKGFAESLLCD